MDEVLLKKLTVDFVGYDHHIREESLEEIYDIIKQHIEETIILSLKSKNITDRCYWYKQGWINGQWNAKCTMVFPEPLQEHYPSAILEL